MPNVSGNKLHQLLKERGSLTPVIFITGHGDIDFAVASIKSGVSDFIEKPINSERLISSIREAIERASATRHEEREWRPCGNAMAHFRIGSEKSCCLPPADAPTRRSLRNPKSQRKNGRALSRMGHGKNAGQKPRRPRADGDALEPAHTASEIATGMSDQGTHTL